MPTWSAGTRPKAPKITKPTVRPTGPKKYRVRSEAILLDSPFTRQAGRTFDSQSELLIYDAFERILGPERYGVWRYQDPVIAGRFEVARVDFVLYSSTGRIGVRVQSERFHYGAGSDKQAYDRNQRLILEWNGWKVVDIPEERFVHDKTGVAAIVVAKKALRGEEEINPITSGTSSGRTARI